MIKVSSRQIHATAFAQQSRKFRISSGAVGTALGDYYELKSSVARILHQNVRLLFYNGVPMDGDFFLPIKSFFLTCVERSIGVGNGKRTLKSILAATS